MTLDEPRNPHHAAALERGDMPQTPERDAAQRIGRILFKYLDAHGTFTDQFKTEVGAKCVAHRNFLRTVFSDLENNPHRIGEKDPIVLRQQQTSQLEDLDFFLEEAAYHKRGYEAAVDIIDRITARRLADHDVDAREQDRQDDRDREQRQDAAASKQAPKVAS